MIKKLLNFVFLIIIIWVVVSIVRPYWDKYWLGQDVEAGAIYGTKNSVEDTRAFLTQKMKEAGRDFTGEDFGISKDENNNVTINLTYCAELRVFGVTLKELEFTLKKTMSEVKASF
jgi:hypothetical protein